MQDTIISGRYEQQGMYRPESFLFYDWGSFDRLRKKLDKIGGHYWIEVRIEQTF